MERLLYMHEDPGLISNIHAKSWDMGMHLQSHCITDLGRWRQVDPCSSLVIYLCQVNELQIQKEILSQIIR